MKSPKLFGIFIFLLSLGVQVYPQVFRIQTGLNLSKMRVSTDLDTRYYTRVHIGITADYTVGHYLSIEAGISSSPKGFRTVTYGETTMGTHREVTLFGPNYVDISFNAKGTYDLENFRIFGFAGPFFAIGTGGKIKVIDYYDGEKAQTETIYLSWGPEEEDNDVQYHLKRYDFGVSFGAGAEFRKVQLRLFYQLGIPDVNSSEESAQELRNRMIGISVGFRFAGS
jgi:hypothetical protein